VREQGSLFVFLQGHPEYETSTLLLEYRRDLARYLKGERKTYPSMPDSYFDSRAQDVLANLEERILAGKQNASPADFPASVADSVLPNTWRSVAAQFYANWLQKLSEDRVSAGASRGRYQRAASAGA
jgi:homoserine O-succinyltransferase